MIAKRHLYSLVACALVAGGCDEEMVKPHEDPTPAQFDPSTHPALAPSVARPPSAGHAAASIDRRAPAAPALGDVLAQFVPPAPCALGNGRGMAFDGSSLYYTILGDPNIYQLDLEGNCLGAIPVSQDLSTIEGGPLAWDGSAFWTMHYAFPDPAFTVYRVDPDDGSIISSCDIAAQNPDHPSVVGEGRVIGERPDGLDWTGNTLWVSSETFANNWTVELDRNCNILTAFNPPVHEGWGTSGVVFDGTDLWHANPIISFQFQTDVLGVLTGRSFSNDLVLEDLACDDVTFPGQPALWANAAAAFENTITAYAVDRCPSVMQVEIDIRPGAPPNVINCSNERGVVPVAILTTDGFDATTVDHTTVTFEGAQETHMDPRTGEPRRHESDVDGDGDQDLVFHFRIGETDLDCASEEGQLQGRTFDGHPIAASDVVRMVPGRNGAR
jgi:hypothetical protein